MPRVVVKTVGEGDHIAVDTEAVGRGMKVGGEVVAICFCFEGGGEGFGEIVVY